MLVLNKLSVTQKSEGGDEGIDSFRTGSPAGAETYGGMGIVDLLPE